MHLVYTPICFPALQCSIQYYRTYSTFTHYPLNKKTMITSKMDSRPYEAFISYNFIEKKFHMKFLRTERGCYILSKKWLLQVGKCGVFTKTTWNPMKEASKLQCQADVTTSIFCVDDFFLWWRGCWEHALAVRGLWKSNERVFLRCQQLSSHPVHHTMLQHARQPPPFYSPHSKLSFEVSWAAKNCVSSDRQHAKPRQMPFNRQNPPLKKLIRPARWFRQIRRHHRIPLVEEVLET